MKKTLFSATVGGLVLGILVSCFNPNRATAQTSSLTPPLKLAQNRIPSNSNYRFELDFSPPSSSIVLAPISPTCSFPPIPTQENLAQGAYGVSVFRRGSPPSTSDTYKPGDGSDPDLGYTVYELVSAKKLDQALQVALKIKAISRKNLALERIVDAYIKVGKLEQALQIAKQITISPHLDYTFSDIADAYMKAGKLEQALLVVESMGDSYDKVNTWLKIAQKYQDVNQPKRAVQVLDQALAAYRSKPSNDPEMPASIHMAILSRLAGRYAVAGQKEQTVKLASEIVEFFKTLPAQNQETFVELISTAGLYSFIGQQDKVNQILAYAVEAAQSTKIEAPQGIKETSARADILVDIANDYIELKQPNRANELLAQALELVKPEPDVSEKNLILIKGARIYGMLGQYEQAFQVINPVLPRSLRDSVKQTLTCSQKQSG